MGDIVESNTNATENNTKLAKTKDVANVRLHPRLVGNIPITSAVVFAPLIHAYVQKYGPVRHHIESFNELIKSRYGLRQIITSIFSIQSDIIPEKTIKSPEDELIERVTIKVNFTDGNNESY